MAISFEPHPPSPVQDRRWAISAIRTSNFGPNRRKSSGGVHSVSRGQVRQQIASE